MRNNGKPQGILRRSFIGKSAKITAAGILLSRLPASSRRATSMEGEIKVALVGCGGRGTGAAAQALQADPDVRLVAMADVFQDQAKACYENLVEQFGDSGQLTSTPETIFIGFDAYKEAIDMADVVILTTPPGFRPLHFEYAVENNKQVCVTNTIVMSFHDH